MKREPTESAKLRARFDAKWCPEPFSGCWLWTGMYSQTMKSKFAYGSIFVNRRPRLAHRISWELFRGPIPSNLCVLHNCDTPMCVNPNHLFLGTRADNNMDKAIKNRNIKTRKLTAHDAKEIKMSRDDTKTLAQRFNVAWRTITDAQRGRTWKHIL